MRLIIRLAKSFDSLGSGGEDVFEQTPMGGTTDETLAQNNKGGKMGDGIRRKVVELSPEVIDRKSVV